MTNEAKDRAIRWLTEEVRSLRLAPTVNGCEPDNWAESLEVMETCLEAVRDHFPDATKMVPLTLEQLRKMDGKPVYLDIFKNSEGSGFRIIESVTDKKILLRGENVTYVPTLNIGKKYNLYAYPPAHIDMEAWTAEWVDNDKSAEMMCKCSKCGYPVSYFWGKTAFCPGCGRAMTPEARAELEKRSRE